MSRERGFRRYLRAGQVNVGAQLFQGLAIVLNLKDENGHWTGIYDYFRFTVQLLFYGGDFTVSRVHNYVTLGVYDRIKAYLAPKISMEAGSWIETYEVRT